MPKFVKGSEEAKNFMKSIRDKRKIGGRVKMTILPLSSKEIIPESVQEAPVEGSGLKKTNSWIRHVQEYSKTHNISYFTALKDPKIKDGYKK